MRVLLQYLLCQYRQTVKPFAHVGCTTSKVNAHRRRWRDHRESTANTRANASASIAASTVKRTPVGRSIQIRTDFADLPLIGRLGQYPARLRQKQVRQALGLTGSCPLAMRSPPGA